MDHLLSGFGAEVFEGYPAPTMVVDGDVRVLVANRAARILLGHERVVLHSQGRRPGRRGDRQRCDGRPGGQPCYCKW
jgi:hypothetical protein